VTARAPDARKGGLTATSLEQAIELHAGEATAARDRFLALSAGERAAIIAFLKTL